MNTQSNQETLFGHPKGLFFLFFAELWERFSFYGMRALLMLYMTDHLLYSDKVSFGVFAAYGSLVYVTPLIGGMIADRVLGYKKSIVLGGILMALGHFVLAIEHPIMFYTALALLIVGNGFFKPNISSLVGSLYDKGDNRRDSGFMIFYMGVNIGGWIAPLLCGWLGISYGWHYGFGLAGIGMLFGLFVFNHASRKGIFGEHGNVTNTELYEKKFGPLSTQKLIILGALLLVPVMALIVRFNEFEHYLIWLVSVVILFVVIFIYRQSTKTEKGQLLVLVYFTSLACVFFIVFEQAGSSLTLFTERNVNLKWINASQSNSLNSAYIVLLAIPFTWLWTYLSRIKMNPNSPVKMGLGLVLVGVGFLIFGCSSNSMNANAQVPMMFLVMGVFVYTIGELFLSPIGLSKVTELSPKKYVAFLMGVWFLASFYGHFFAGKIAQLTTVKEGQESIFTQGIFKSITPKITGLDYELLASAGEQHLQLYSYV
ncbi:MAG: peptide MFS transporter, partial [Crocinitomicaceae bacterium]